MKIPGFKGSKKKVRCDQDPQTGNVRCERYEKFEDGTEQTLASAEFQFDANCKPIPSHIEGNEEELKKLERTAVGYLKTKCQSNMPKDF